MINPQGSSGVAVTEDQTGTLVAQDHGHHPAVLQSAGFSTEHSANSRSIGYEEEKSPTLRGSVVPAALSVENHPADGRVKIREDGKVQTLCERAGTGGNNVPLVAERENKSYGIGKEAFSSGLGGNFNFAVNEETAPTMQAAGPCAVAAPRAFGVCSKSSFSMKSENPHSGFYEAETSRTLDQGGGNPTCNQGGICVVSPEPIDARQGSVIGRAEENGSQGNGVYDDVSYTQTSVDRYADTAPAEGGETYSATTGKFMTVGKEVACPVMARDYKDPQIVNDTPNDEPVYIVRRLTPVECARLQGFPDWWCDDLAIPDPSEEELAFWTDVWEIWRKLTNPEGKPKGEKQIRRWLASPYSDGAAYKLWGNGLCLENSYFVLAGIAWAAAVDCQK